MSKYLSIAIIVIVSLGIIGFLFLNVSEYSCDSSEENENGVVYQYETCCRYLGFSCFTEKKQINQ